jgi:MFS family permease
VKRNRIRVLAWLLAGLAIASSVIQAVLWAARLSAPPTLFDAVEALGWGLTLPLVFSILAAMIISRQPGNRVGWLMMIVALALTTPLDLLLQQMQGPPETATIGLWILVWLSGWSWIPIIFPIFLIPLYFPTGDLASPRWKWIPGLALGMWIAFMILSFFLREGGPINADWTMANPVGFLPEDILSGPFVILWGISLLTILGASVVSLFRRYRRAASAERQQIRWLLFAGSFFLIVYAIFFFAFQDLQNGWQNLVFVLSVLAMPIAIAVAIFRYRLWEIDLIIRRTLVYVPLSALLAGVFAASIKVSQAFFSSMAGSSPEAPTVLTTLVVVAAFDPLKGWLQRAVDARFKEVTNPQKRWSDLGEQVRTYVEMNDPARLLRRFLEEAVTVFEAKGGSVYLRESGELKRMHALGNWETMPAISVPLQHLGEDVGRLSLSERRDGKPFDTRDRASLERVADSVAAAVSLSGIRSTRIPARPNVQLAVEA